MKFFLVGLLLGIDVAYAKSWEVVNQVCEWMDYKDCSLVKAIITVESSNNPLAIGKDGAGSLGLMQVKCSTARVLDRIHGRKPLKCSDLFDPYINVRYGIEYLNYIDELLTNKPTVPQLLSVYNGGYMYHRPTNTYRVKLCNAISLKKKRKCKQGIEPFNVGYSRKVIQAYNKITKE